MVKLAVSALMTPLVLLNVCAFTFNVVSALICPAVLMRLLLAGVLLPFRVTLCPAIRPELLSMLSALTVTACVPKMP